MTISRKIKMGLAAIFIAGLGQQVLAAPIVVLDDPRVARQILNLNVLGTFYNVTFNNVGDSTFISDTTGATAARDAINAALNQTTADLVRILNTGVSVNNYGVQDSPTSTVRGVSFFVAGNWQASAGTFLLAPIAQFQLAEVPLPATLALLGIGLAGIGYQRYGRSTS